MEKYSFDYDSLEKSLSTKKTYKLSEVQDRLEKVAFDVVRFMDGSEDIDKLWRIEKQEDGNEYIVAVYDEDSPLSTQGTTASSWYIGLNKSASHMTVYYKGEPITKIATSEFDASPEQASALCKHLPNKLANNKKLVSALLNDLPEKQRDALKEKHPELS